MDPLSANFPTPDGEAGFRDARFYSFRHYFVSKAFIQGAGEGEIRSWVGHTDSRIVERYRHLSDDDARRKMRGLELVKPVPNCKHTEKTSVPSRSSLPEGPVPDGRHHQVGGEHR